jgi:hypothetical protein
MAGPRERSVGTQGCSPASGVRCLPARPTVGRGLTAMAGPRERSRRWEAVRWQRREVHSLWDPQRIALRPQGFRVRRVVRFAGSGVRCIPARPTVGRALTAMAGPRERSVGTQGCSAGKRREVRDPQRIARSPQWSVHVSDPSGRRRAAHPCATHSGSCSHRNGRST